MLGRGHGGEFWDSEQAAAKPDVSSQAPMSIFVASADLGSKETGSMTKQGSHGGDM